uniref:Uncharacterized protein n=1 Tax=Anopheles christyi TaxID=43041 RepID=A0A3F2YTX7_9DIPT
MRISHIVLHSIFHTLHLHLQITNAFIRMIATGTKVEFHYNKAVFNISYIFHETPALEDQWLDFDIDIKKQLNDLRVSGAQIAHVGNDGSLQVALIKRRVELCSYLRNRNKDRLIKNFVDYLYARSHLPPGCPFPPGSYYMCNLKLSDVPIPAFLPEANYMLELLYYSEVRGRALAELRIHGRIVRLIDNILALPTTRSPLKVTIKKSNFTGK